MQRPASPPSPHKHLQSYQVAALEQLPLALLLVSLDGELLFANRACQSLFGADKVVRGSSLSELPFSWPKGSEDTVGNTLTDNVASALPLRQVISDTRIHPVTILTASSAVRHFADAHVTVLDGVEDDVRMLSFQNVEAPGIHAPAAFQGAPAHGLTSPIHNSPSIEEALSPRSLRKKPSESSLNEQFGRLREAIYYSNDDSGFMIDADETIVFPNWNGADNVEPVRLKNGAADFLDWYDIWDTAFREKLPLADYPARRLNTERTKHRGYRLGLRVDGRDLIVECSGDPLFDKDTGEYIGGVVWVRTLGERDEVLLADMKASLSDYQTICERLPHILWTMTPEGDIDYFTKNWYEFTGVSETDCLGKGFDQVFHPDDLARFHESVRIDSDNSADSADKFIEARCRRHDGAFLWFAVAAKPLFDGEGKLLKWYGTMTEIQALVSERQEADRKKTQMQDMLTLANVSLFEVNHHLQLTARQGQPFWRTTPRAFAQIGLAEVQSGGVPVFESHARTIMDRRNDRADFEFELQNRWFKCRLVKDVGTDLRTVSLLGCAVDITDQRQKSLLVVENSRLVTERAVALEKNRLKDEFLAHMSHEVRTPIAGVIGMAEVLQETELTESQNETLRDIIDSANNLLGIVNDILDLSKIDAGKMTLERVELNVPDLLEQVSRVFQHSVRHKPVELRTAVVTPFDLIILGDPTKIRQIISNLLSNAIKFTSQGSVVLSVSTSPGEICIMVTDTGIGISESTLAKLFSPFVQGDSSTARKYGGTGLGLAICRGLAEMMGGSLWIDSEVGVGTTARLRLPSHVASEPAEFGTLGNDDTHLAKARVPVETKSVSLGEDPLILIVDDNAINRKFALHMIKKHGYRGVAAANGQEALDCLISSPGNIAVILMDCQMPIMDGYETTRRIRNDTTYAAWKDIPIVAFTASATSGDREKCEAAGMQEYLTKPVSYENFTKIVGTYLPARPQETIRTASKAK